MRVKALILCSALVVGFAQISLAQDSGYVPPPLFDDQVRPHSDTGNLVEPRVSTITETVPDAPVVAPAAPALPEIVEQPKAAATKPIIEERRSVYRAAPAKPETVSTETNQPAPQAVAKSPPPAPPKKPVVAGPTIAKVTPTPKTEEKPAPAPEKTADKKGSDSKYRPASKVTSAGVVTGPVSMPSVPTQHVETVESAAEIAPSTGDDGLTIMERHQRQISAAQSGGDKKTAENVKAKDEKVAAAKATAQTAVAPAEFENAQKQEVMKKVLPFKPGEIALSEQDILAIGAGIKEELEKRDHWRIQIRSYATSFGEGASSDKRISLSRAIALRKALVDQGVRSSRIDVRAEGAVSMPEGKSGDRIDLYLYRPSDNTIIF